MKCQKTPKYNQYIIPLFLLTLSSNSNATSISVSYGQQEYQVSLQNETVNLTPVGNAVSFSTNITDNLNLNLNLNYQNWQDDRNHENRVNAEVELTTIGTSLSYYLDNWSFSSNYSQSTVDTKISGLRREINFNNENIDSASLGGSIGYGFIKGDWFYGILVGGLYSDWDFNKYQIKDSNQDHKQSKITSEKSSGNSSIISTSLSTAYYLPFSNEKGLMLGGLLTWNYLISGDSVLISRNGKNVNTRPISRDTSRITNSNSASLNAISGDDNYGQFALYASYDLGPSWSLDIDASINIASDYDAYAWSVSLGYIF
ncbi:hypothetical protein CJF42_08830 [Pseudoalteromonas sp. NBT06-2]|uniref:hypothetical protein n=1 Tax=Pseudoalteromonas sp. NBT06-2 TaxID=2025950 RepID=UPI000BA5312D|nr:hypothetical protein [Pseudoalteromonas sp. NBT06-2]PAJ74774.1 hypothetical protein CJF42_08830 [Pseudoalteromonas sp. NBT06-2]